VRRASAGHVARECRVDVTVGENEISAVEQREDLPLAAVRKIGRVQERKCHRRQQAPLFPAPRRGPDQRRRIPFGKVNPVSADLQPALEKIELCAFAGAVNSLDDHEGARIFTFGYADFFERAFGYGGLFWRNVLGHFQPFQFQRRDDSL